LSATLQGYENRAFAHKIPSENQTEIIAYPPKAGMHILTIFARRKGEVGSSIMEYRLDVTGNGGLEDNSFPVCYGRFSEYGCYLHSPMNSRLKPGSLQHFKVQHNTTQKHNNAT
jgi:hypothetical protein